ncbi:hypothetical protein OIU76_029129 [Salix suchowensis]|nr:hypothetical protein OIU76_029129 [Salix suchowensis]
MEGHCRTCDSDEHDDSSDFVKAIKEMRESIMPLRCSSRLCLLQLVLENLLIGYKHTWKICISNKSRLIFLYGFPVLALTQKLEMTD